MLRVGLTGGLGSGKSTAAQMFRAKGAYVLSADEIGRELMQPGQAVYSAIVERFGAGVVGADGQLDRAALARIAFGGEGEGSGRVEELNAIVHPATIARQAELIQEIAAKDRDAVVVVESALIFETKYGETKHGGGAGIARRFDTVVFVKAPEGLRIARFLERMSRGEGLSAERRDEIEAQALRRMARQEAERNEGRCDYVLTNDGSLDELRAQVDAVWPELKKMAKGRSE
ncbi:MAG: dephospho-CoA kinase [Acidobacteriaceae bacterium]|jgi:dephospho-CoA kinase